MAMVRIDRMKRNPVELEGPLQQVSLSTASGQRLDVIIQPRRSAMFSGDYFDANATAYDKKGVPIFILHVGQTSLPSVFTTLASSLRVQKLGALAKAADAHAMSVRTLYMSRDEAEALLKPHGLRLLAARDIVTFFPIHTFDGAVPPAELHDKHESIRVLLRRRMNQYQGAWIVYDPSDDEDGWMLRGALDDIVPESVQHFETLRAE